MADRLYLSPPHMGGDERRYVDEVFATNWIAPVGPMVDRFEADLARVTGYPAVVALSSGTAALHLALRLSGVGPGDEVWGATMTFIGGVAPILYRQAVPVFLDIDPDTLLLDLDQLEASLDERRRRGEQLPKAVISTDLYGTPVDIERMSRLAAAYGFVWISDTAEALGAQVGGRHAGAGANFAVLSFNGNKIITTSGGGALCCRDPEQADRARFLSTQARDPAPHYEHSTYGYNYRLSGLCAAVGVGQLEMLAERVAARRAIHARYRAAFATCPAVRFHAEPSNCTANRWLTTIEIDPALSAASPETVRRALETHNIESRPLWKPMHLQPVMAGVRAIGGAAAEGAFRRGLCLPSGSAMTMDMVDHVAALALDVLRT